MPIPKLNKLGYLPAGIHDCTLPEIKKRFGNFQTNSRRVELFESLEKFVGGVGNTGVVGALIVDGSFVTGNASPNDIDIILVLAKDFSFDEELPPAVYNVLSRRRVKRRYKFDVFVDKEQSPAYKEHVAFFQQVRNSPRRRKGCLRLKL